MNKLISLAALICLVLTLYPRSALAQVSLLGNWQSIDDWNAQQLVVQGPPPVDFVGLPLNRAGRAMAATADPAQEQEELYRQCQPWLVNYFVEGSFPIVMTPITNRLNPADILGWKLTATPDRLGETIWIDGRPPPPPLAWHSWAGFASGQWRGQTLDVSVTHLKDSWLFRGDAPESNKGTARIFFTREGNLLTETFIIHDPVYLSAPYPRARVYRLYAGSPSYNIPAANNCMPAEVIANLSDGYHAARYLPGKNPDLNWMQVHYNIPPQVALGGAQEMYPEFLKTLRKEYRIPSGYCHMNCCLSEAFRGTKCPAPTPGPALTRNSRDPDQSRRQR